MRRLGFARGQLVELALGLPMLAYGVRGVILDPRGTHPFGLGRWIVGSAIVHDALLVPVVLVVSFLVARLLPTRARPPVLWALTTSAILAASAWPFIRGYGRDPRIPSLLARNSATGLLALVGVVAVVAAAWASIRRR